MLQTQELKRRLLVWLTITVSSVSFPALERVGSYIRIFTEASREIKTDRSDPVDIDFPLLIEVRDLDIEGHVRRFVAENPT